MIEGACACGAVHWTLEQDPTQATACNCTICRRYGVLWAYDVETGVRVSGETRRYVRGEWVEFHFCAVCGCVAYWRGQKTDEQGRRRMAVNLRLAEPAAVAHVPIEHLDGLVNFEPLPGDGRRVGDYWF